MSKSLRVCSRCVLDETAELEFDEDGVCHYCRKWDEIAPQLEEKQKNGDAYFSDLKKRLKREGGPRYDSIIGLSGGVDSSYVALLAKRLQLNPLLVHFDNGWNSEVAVSNIKKIANSCGFDLETYVIDWQEFRDLQRAFFRASVLDVEMLTDHAIMAVLMRLSRKHRTRNVLSGNNYATEFGMPEEWSWNKMDYTNIKAIHSQFGERNLKTFPVLTTWTWLAINKLGIGLNYLQLLDYLPYRKETALKELQEEFDWVYYGGKHYESTFTKFYQAHYLPEKFGIDKRKAHYSSLIRNGEISRDEVLEILKSPPYDPQELEQDREYVLKKLGFTEQEFDAILRAKTVAHTDYRSDHQLFKKAQRVYRGVQKAVGLKR